MVRGSSDRLGNDPGDHFRFERAEPSGENGRSPQPRTGGAPGMWWQAVVFGSGGLVPTLHVTNFNLVDKMLEFNLENTTKGFR